MLRSNTNGMEWGQTGMELRHTHNVTGINVVRSVGIIYWIELHPHVVICERECEVNVL